MASGGKKKTTMAKLMREQKLRERRQDKKAKKDARKLAPVDSEWIGQPASLDGEPAAAVAPELEAAVAVAEPVDA